MNLMSNNQLTEKCLVKDLKLLKDLKKTWNDFAEIVQLASRTVLDYHYKYASPGGKSYSEEGVRALKEDILQMQMLRRRYELQDYKRIVKCLVG